MSKSKWPPNQLQHVYELSVFPVDQVAIFSVRFLAADDQAVTKKLGPAIKALLAQATSEQLNTRYEEVMEAHVRAAERRERAAGGPRHGFLRIQPSPSGPDPDGPPVA